MTTAVDLGKCLSLLRAPSDEEKFVGLLLVTKFVQRPTPSVLHQIAEAIGFPFLHRLLRSKQGEGTFSYQDLALSILSTFAAEAELASHPQYLATVPLLLSIINAEDVADGTKLEALKCLLGVAQTAAGLSALLSYEALPKIALSIFEADPKDERLSLTFQLFETVLRHSHQQLHLQHHPQERFALTLRDFEQKGAMHHLSCLFRQNQQSFKFALLQRLNLLMSYFRDCKEAIEEEEDENEEKERWKWKEDIRIGLNDILTSKLGRAQRDMAFVLCAHMLHRFGQEWALGPPLHFVASKEDTEEKVKKREAKGKDRTEVFSTEAKTTTSLEEKGRFVEVLVLLVCVEAQFLLETTVLHPDRYRPSPASLTLSPSTAPLSITSSSPTDSTHDPCSSSSSEENYNVDMISVCYDIVEQVIYYLSHSPMESTAQQKQTKKRYWSEELPSPVLSSIQRGLSDVFTVIVQYLRKCKDEQDEAPVLSQPTKTKDSILLVATIRLLGVWLSEETSALRSEILEVLPFLLQQSFDRTRTNEEKEGDQMFSFLLPGLLHLTSEKDARGIFLGNNGPALLLSYIKRHYPSFCSVVVNSGSLGAESKEGSESIMNAEALFDTVLGVLLNIVCLDGSSAVLSDKPTFLAFLPVLHSISSSLLLHFSSSQQGFNFPRFLLLHVLVAAIFILRTCKEEEISSLLQQPTAKATEELNLTTMFDSFLRWMEMMSDDMKSKWSDEQTAELWFMALTGVTSCMEHYPSLCDALCTHDAWLKRCHLRVLSCSSSAQPCSEEEKQETAALASLLSSLAKHSSKGREVLHRISSTSS